MYQEKSNPVREKSYAFALHVVTFCRGMMQDKEYVLSTQLLKSGTSIGANIEEAVNAPSKRDFIAKLSIALKEAYESRYWLMLIRDSRLGSDDDLLRLLSEVQELIALLTSIIKTSRATLI